MPLATRSRYSRTSLTWPAAITTVPGSQTSASALMSLSGSPDSLRSTNRMLGLADTDSVRTAFLRPPLLTFSGDQPWSTASGRSRSAVASSETKAVKGSLSPPPRALNGAFILITPGGRARKRLRARWRAVAIDPDGAAGDAGAAESRSVLLPDDQIVGIADHRGQIGVGRAAEIAREVDVGFEGVLPPVRAAGDAGGGAAGDHPDASWRHGAGEHRGAVAEQQPVSCGHARDVAADRAAFIAPGLVDDDAVAVAGVDRGEPSVEPLQLGCRDIVAAGRQIEHEVGALHDRLV